MSPSDTAHFSPELFKFLRSLRRNNDREWFERNKDRYVQHVRDPMLRFIEDFAPRLRRISRRFVADARPNGGSMFRIYRDVRFSKDKSPYKTVAAVHFRHEQGRDVHVPGFYLHLGPGEVFAGAGIWRPDSATATKVRHQIVEKASAWKRILRSDAFDGLLRLDGDTLKRPPRGFDPEHPLLEDLKRKDFTVVAHFDEQAACDPDFIDVFTEVCRASGPFVRFLTRAVEVEW